MHFLQYSDSYGAYPGNTGGATTALATPTGLTATPTSNRAIGLSWNAVANASSYLVQRASNSAFTANVTTVYAGTGTSTIDGGLTTSTGYYYDIVAAGTGAYSNSPPSAVVSGSTNGPLALIAVGDSRTNGDWASATHSYPEEVARALGIPLAARLGYSGFTSQQLNSQHLADVQATFVAGKTNAVLLRIGTNDLYANGLASAKTSIVQLITNLLNTPNFVVEVHWVPEINRRDSYATATFDADRLNLNAYLKTYALAGYHYVTPLENEPAFYGASAYNANLAVGGTATDNLTISKEGVHEIDQGTLTLGALVIAPYLATYYGLPAVAGITPLALANNTTNALVFQHILGLTAMEVQPSGGAFTSPAAASYAMGSGATAANAYSARLKALPGRAVSPVVGSPAFAALPAPPANPSTPVVWANFANRGCGVTTNAAGGSRLSAVSVNGNWADGGSSTKAVGAVSNGTGELGRLTFPAVAAGPDVNSGWVAGLTNAANTTGTLYTAVRYGFYRDNTLIRVFQLGAVAYEAPFPAGTPTLDIVVFPTYVSYQVNGTEVFRNTSAPVFPLFAEADFNLGGNAGCYVENVTISAQNLIASGF